MKEEKYHTSIYKIVGYKFFENQNKRGSSEDGKEEY